MSVNTFPCAMPWTSLVVHQSGAVSVCCYQAPFAHVDDVARASADRIWNAPFLQQLRQKLATSGASGTPCAGCVGLAQYREFAHPFKDGVPGPATTATTTEDRAADSPPGESPAHRPSLLKLYNGPAPRASPSAAAGPDEAHVRNARVSRTEWTEGRATLSSLPLEIIYNPSIICNIDCIHCFQPPSAEHHKHSIDEDPLTTFHRSVGAMATRLVMAGGEPLMLKQTYAVLEAHEPARRRWTDIQFVSNGLLAARTFPRLEGFRSLTYRLSIPSFRPAVYDHIQRGGSFERLRVNLDFLRKAREQGTPVALHRAMVVMRSNFDDLRTLTADSAEWGIEDTSVMPVHQQAGRSLIHNLRFVAQEGIFTLPALVRTIPGWRETIEIARREAETCPGVMVKPNVAYVIRQLEGGTVPAMRVLAHEVAKVARRRVLTTMRRYLPAATA